MNIDSEPISHRGLIRALGEDAASFLNAQLTRRVDDLADGELRLAAWCNAKGRVLALVRVARADGGYALWLPARLAPLTLPSLQRFVLRSRVRLEQGPAETSGGNATSRLAEIRAGIPEIYPETREQFLPQMLNLDRLGGIDFKKGCYPGQEIVARSQYLGQLKRRMYLFAADGPGLLPAPGTVIVSAGDAGGTVVDAARTESGETLILAVIPIEGMQLTWRLADSGMPLRLQPLPYATG
jgi:folate-binding protein YgfZ